MEMEANASHPIDILMMVIKTKCTPTETLVVLKMVFYSVKKKRNDK